MRDAIYVPPRQIREDKKEYCLEELGQCNPLVALKFRNGILLATLNLSATQNKIFEAYDKMALGMVGSGSDMEPIRQWFLNKIHIDGFSHGRESVRGRSAASSLAEVMGKLFKESFPPPALELVLCEADEKESLIFYVSFDGGNSAHDFAVIPGHEKTKEALKYLKDNFRVSSLEEAFMLSLSSLKKKNEALRPEMIEAAVLDVTIKKRVKFRRLKKEEVEDYFTKFKS